MAWSAVGVPDGGDGDVKTGINFYWTEVFNGWYSGHAGRTEVFYYWTLPIEEQQMTDTQAPEEFMINPEEVDLLPGEVQDGEEGWTVLDPPD